MRIVFAATLLILVPLVSSAHDAKPRPMTVEDLFRFKRISDPQISPDGKSVVYVQGDVSLEKNSTTRSLWIADTSGEKTPRRLTASNKSDSHPRWSPDGKSILFESNRSGTGQLWIIDVDGGEARQLTNISTGAGTGIWSRDGKSIAFVSAVWPEYSEKPFAESDKLNKKRIDEQAASPVKARVASRLFFRHWDEYVEDKRQHLFVVPFADGKAGETKDVTPGDRDAYPTSSTFSVGDDFTFSPDGAFLYFTAVPDKDEAWNTNYDICRVPVTGGTTKWETITTGNGAADSGPQFSPDGKWLAWRAQKRSGYEADRWELYVAPADRPGDSWNAMPDRSDLDASVETFVWYGSDSFVVQYDSHGASVLGGIRLDKARSVWRFANISGSSWSQPSIASGTASDERKIVFLNASFQSPPELARIHRLDISVTHQPLTNTNAALLKTIDFGPRPESVTVKGAGGTPMQMWILKPPGFDAKKRWPLVYLVHGGPQGAWNNDWSYRWNASLWAAQGYVVALPNPRGSTGFGQKYVDEISGDWGGKCYEDLMAGVAYLEELPYIDKNRMAAAGASFGGYMVNWFAVNTSKFKCLITHCGVWNFESMYALTEELWFDEWEHGGPPWGKNRESYEKHSPHKLAGNLGKFKTPMLVVHNDLDYRVAVAEGIQLFTTLQRQGVPSRFVNFPDEGHWVLRPRNSEFWYREVFGWLKKHVEPGGK